MSSYLLYFKKGKIDSDIYFKRTYQTLSVKSVYNHILSPNNQFFFIIQTGEHRHSLHKNRLCKKNPNSLCDTLLVPEKLDSKELKQCSYKNK